jgi:hypothetical protein
MVFIFALGFIMLENSSPFGFLFMKNQLLWEYHQGLQNLEYPWAWVSPIHFKDLGRNVLIIFGGHLLCMNIPPRRDIIPTP